jgi:hypothetical protein
MRSPFPGIDPYLENPELWAAVHNRLIVAIADDLVDRLSEKYRVEIEKRTYFTSDEDSILVGIPNVTIATGSPPNSNPAATSPSTTLVLPIQPELVTVPIAEEVNEWYLEIREVGTGAVVTTLELLSPKNKRPGEGRTAYERKRNRILSSTTHLVEIDFLRGGKPFPIASMRAASAQEKCGGDYRILICRGNRRPTGELYAFSVYQPVPPVPIPLIPGESEPILELQPLIDRVYQKGRYHLAIDYNLPPQPPFSAEDRQWVQALPVFEGAP